MIELSRRCIPWTPFTRTIAEARICLVSSAGVRMQSSPPFNPESDTSFRVIEGLASGADLTYDDEHYDHACVDADINCVFPLDRLRELASEGRILGLTDHHYAFGFSMKLRELREQTFPAMVSLVDRLRPDLVLLTGG